MILLLASVAVGPAIVATDMDARGSLDATSRSVQEDNVSNESQNNSDHNWIGGGSETPESDGEGEGDEGDEGDGSVVDRAVDVFPSAPSAPSLPSPREWAEDLLLWIVDQLKTAVIAAIDKFHYILVGVPAPGEPTDPISWNEPQNEVWPAVFAAYGLSSLLALIILCLSTMDAMNISDERIRKKQIGEISKALIWIVAGPLLIGVYLHTANGLALAFTPPGEAFIDTPEKVTALGLGVLVGAVLIKLKLIAILAGLAALAVIYVMIISLAATWPLLRALKASRSQTFSVFGESGLTTFYVLPALRVAQGLMLGMLFQLSWDSLIVTITTIAVGLSFILIGLPVFAIMVTVRKPLMYTLAGGPLARGLTRGRRRGYSSSRSGSGLRTRARNLGSGARSRIRNQTKSPISRLRGRSNRGQSNTVSTRSTAPSGRRQVGRLRQSRQSKSATSSSDGGRNVGQFQQRTGGSRTSRSRSASTQQTTSTPVNRGKYHPKISQRNRRSVQRSRNDVKRKTMLNQSNPKVNRTRQ